MSHRMLVWIAAVLAVGSMAAAPLALGSSANGVPCQGDGAFLGAEGVRTGSLGSWEDDDYNIWVQAGTIIVIAAEWTSNANVLEPPLIHFASWIGEQDCTMICEGAHVVVCQAISTGTHTIGVHSHGSTGSYAVAWAVLVAV